jgi:hypothetical protein
VEIDKPVRDMNAKIRVDPDQMGIERRVMALR